MTSAFLENVGAGLLIFVLDVVLIAIILPVILQRRADQRWKSVRRNFINLHIREHKIVIRAINNIALDMYDFKDREDGVRRVQLLPSYLEFSCKPHRTVLPVFAPALTSEMVTSSSGYIHSTEDLISSLREVTDRDASLNLVQDEVEVYQQLLNRLLAILDLQYRYIKDLGACGKGIDRINEVQEEALVEKAKLRLQKLGDILLKLPTLASNSP